MKENWIWLNEKVYPEYQKSFYTRFSKDKADFNYCVAEFKKTYEFEKEVKSVEIKASADCKYILYLNGEYVSTGIVCRGGDYDFKGIMPYVYYSTYNRLVSGKVLTFCAKVQLLPVVEVEVSSGHGGFCLEAEITFSDGSKTVVNTDETWLSRRATWAKSGRIYDYRLKEEDFSNSVLTENIWNLKKSPILPMAEEKIEPIFFMATPVKPNEVKNITVYFDKIYSCYPCFSIKAKGEYEIKMHLFENNEPENWCDIVCGNNDLSFRSMKLQSLGGIRFEIENKGDEEIVLEDVYVYFSHYPVTMQGMFKCNDENLNKIYEVGAHTLKLCLQSLELDSPRHQENLGCTGDYFLETIFNTYTFGNFDLTRFDITRTADLMRITDAKMYHTTYSLIWVQMLLYYYKVTGDKTIFAEVSDMLYRLLERFNTYVGDSALIEKPYDYMFVDWISHDGHSLHHPPKALGQGPLNAFYYKALTDGAEICKIIGNTAQAEIYLSRAEKIYKAFNELLFDRERGLYIAGLSTPQELQPDGKIDSLMPENTNKKYFGMHTNALAVLYKLCPENIEKDVMTKVMEDETLITVQPYFMHFVLDAVYKSGLFDKYGLNTIYRWKRLIDICPKAMREGWIDMPGYGYDFSHAWGCTPIYQLPSKILGLEIIEPGFKKVRINPNLFGLDYADIKVPTPYGVISAHLDKNEIMLDVPEEITIE